MLRLIGELFAYAEAYAGIFPLGNADFISKRDAALNSWLLCKTSAYAEAYAAKCLIEITYFISEDVCLREAYAGKRFASK